MAADSSAGNFYPAWGDLRTNVDGSPVDSYVYLICPPKLVHVDHRTVSRGWNL
jgi:hypothetical protein